MYIKAEDLADGHWPEILQRAGVDPSYLVNGRGGPCPFCGGTDRYAWFNKRGGIYLCRKCTDYKYRSGMDFLMRHMNYTFREAADYVREYFGVTGGEGDLKIVQRLAQTPAHRTADVDVEKSLRRMNRQLSESRAVEEGDPVYSYLMRRVPGLVRVPEEIRFHPALEYWDPPAKLGDPPILVGKFPAMLVRGFDARDRLVQLHKTYLTVDGFKAPVKNVKKTDVGVGSNSYALRIGIPGDTLGVCEGVETGLASTVMRDIPVWPCHSSSILANFELPEIYRGVVRKLVIFTDSDPLKRGRRAGEEAAKALADKARRHGLRSVIERPAKIGDFADLNCEFAQH